MSDYLTKTQYISRARGEILDYLPDSFTGATVREEKYSKQYGEVDGLGVLLPGENGMPIFDLNEFYKDYLFTMEQHPEMSSERAFDNSMQYLSDEICKNTFRMKSMNLPDLGEMTYEKLKERLVIALTCLEGREEFLRDKPHEIVGTDLAILYKIEISDREEEACHRATITKDMMEGLGIDPRRLSEDALRMSRKNNPAKIAGLFECIEEHLPGVELPPEKDGPVVVTTENEIEGAAALMYPGVMEMASGRMGGSYYVIPSSIHEVILLPEEEGFKNSELEALVKNTNQIAVAPRDRLSDHVYHYDAKEKVFERADVYENRLLKKQIMEAHKKEKAEKKEMKASRMMEM